MVTMRRLPLLVFCAGLALGARGAAAEEAVEEVAAPAAEPVAHAAAPDVEPARIRAAIDRGVAFLVATQKKDGSWGSPASTLSDIYAPIPGSYYAFQVAASALAVTGLLECGAISEEGKAALRKGTDFLLANHAVKRVSADTIYNTWSHAYALETFARLIASEKDEARIAKLRAAGKEALEMLERFEFVDGGWGYYDFDVGARRPGPGSTSFTTATVLIALKMAADAGIEVPKRLVDRGRAMVIACRKPDDAFAYAFDHRFWPQGGINQIKGSLARTPPCLLALEAWGDEIEPARHLRALDRLQDHGHFLRIARKYPIPHETWYQNSGYFCFYGYYYASDMLRRVGEEDRRRHARWIASHLLPLQEEDGSWWDYQLYGYHKPYGTGYVLTTLARCEAVLADAPQEAAARAH
jgi:hypothetical protein